MWNFTSMPRTLTHRWLARQKNKGRGRRVSLRISTTGLPLCELCWGWESERCLITALIELFGLLSLALLTDDTMEGKSELVRGKEGGEAPLWVYKFILYPWPKIQTVSFMQLLIIKPITLSPMFLLRLCVQNPQWFIKWSNVLAARPRAVQHIDLIPLLK